MAPQPLGCTDAIGSALAPLTPMYMSWAARLVPNGAGDPAGLTVELTSIDLTKALRGWGRRREQLDAGEMTPDEHRGWKDTHQSIEGIGVSAGSRSFKLPHFVMQNVGRGLCWNG